MMLLDAYKDRFYQPQSLGEQVILVPSFAILKTRYISMINIKMLPLGRRLKNDWHCVSPR